MNVTNNNLQIDQLALAAFCQKWKVVEFSLFGSVLRDDFRSDSDVDVLVSFSPDASWGLFDLGAMEEELAQMFGRRVDLVLRKSVERSKNPYRRESILGSAQRIYGAQ